MSLTHTSCDAATIVLSNVGLITIPHSTRLSPRGGDCRLQGQPGSTRFTLKRVTATPAVYPRTTSGGTAAKAGRCLSHAQAPLVLPLETILFA
jgi:hypothetical protein